MTNIENGINIRFNLDDSVLVDYMKDGHIFHKVLPASEVINAILQSNCTNCVIKSGVLPKGCISYTQDIDTNDSYYVLEYAEGKADIVYHETEYKNFPLPKLLYGIAVAKEGKVTTVNVTVVDHNAKLDETTPLYYYPFSNVNGFKMCVGANKLPTYKKIAALTNLPYFLFGIPDNNDYYRKGNTRLGLEYRDLLEHLKDKSPEYYYTDVLVKSKLTLNDFI